MLAYSFPNNFLEILYNLLKIQIPWPPHSTPHYLLRMFMDGDRYHKKMFVKSLMKYVSFHECVRFADHFAPPPVPSSSTNVAPASSVQDMDASYVGRHSPAPSPGPMPVTVHPSVPCNGNSPQTVPSALVEPAPKRGRGRPHVFSSWNRHCDTFCNSSRETCSLIYSVI